MATVLPAQWVINKKFDLVFFLCPISIGLLYFLSLVLAPGHAFLMTVIVWIVFEQTHFGSTWFIYFDRKNRAYYAEHPFIYYVFPLLIFAAVLVLGSINQTLLIICIALASFYHVTKQNTGILQLYRVRNKEFDLFARKTENFTIFAWSLFFGLFGALHLPHFVALLRPVLPIAWFMDGVFLAAAVIGTVMILRQSVSRSQNSIPKNVFLLTSVLMYSPYLYASAILVDIYQMEIATLTSLIAHYVQYVGIVWLININKYGADTQYAKSNSLLHAIARHYWTIVGVIIAYSLLMAAFRWGIPSRLNGALTVTLPNIVIALTAIHFYIDSFIWRFRNPYVKETVMPFIRPVETTA